MKFGILVDLAFTGDSSAFLLFNGLDPYLAVYDAS
jgi:hypothetical protein